jgi:hypothetical protein
MRARIYIYLYTSGTAAKQTYLRFIGEQRVVLVAGFEGAFGDGRVLENVHVIKELQQIKRVARQQTN